MLVENTTKRKLQRGEAVFRLVPLVSGDRSLAELEAFIGKPIKYQVEALYTQEQYDVVPM